MTSKTQKPLSRQKGKTMNRYIDAIPLIEKWEKECGRGTNNGICQGDCFDCQFPTAIDDLKDAPTIDAVPVEWIKNYIKRTEDNGNTFAAVQYEMMLWDYLADGERRTE